MTTVTGTVRSLRATILAGAQLRWKYMSQPAYVGGALVASSEDVVTKTDGTGDFSQALTAGSYELTIDGYGADKWIVGVPNDNLSYDVMDLITSSVTSIPSAPTLAAIPNASSTTAGKVKTTKDGTNIRVATGIWFVADVAALKALPSDASNSGVFLTAPNAGEPSKVYWDNLSSAADDPTGFTVIKPTDNPTTGRWIPFS